MPLSFSSSPKTVESSIGEYKMAPQITQEYADSQGG